MLVNSVDIKLQQHLIVTVQQVITVLLVKILINLKIMNVTRVIIVLKVLMQ